MIDAVLLDLDDTCFDQREFLAGAFAAVARRAGELGVDEARFHSALVTVAAAGSDRGRIIDRALETVGACIPVGPLVEEFRSYRPVQLSPYPGLREGLGQMRSLAPLGLVTNGDPTGQRAKITALDLDGAFDVIVLSDELGRDFRKPHPARSAARCSFSAPTRAVRSISATTPAVTSPVPSRSGCGPSGSGPGNTPAGPTS